MAAACRTDCGNLHRHARRLPEAPAVEVIAIGTVGKAVKSSLLTIIRTVILFVLLEYLFSRISLNCFWLTFLVKEVITTLTGVIFYRQFMKKEEAKRVVRT